MLMIPANEESGRQFEDLPSQAKPPKTATQQPRIINCESLFAGDTEVLIQNGGEFYRLRRTRNGKLILYK